jgi:formamidase
MRIQVDASRQLAAEPSSGHNRWHPDIEPIARVRPGESVTIETRDGIDGQLTPASTAADVLALDLGLGHPLTGPIEVEDAEPGDVLEVEIVELESAPFGVSAIYPGFGLLAEDFPDPFIVRWEIAAGAARAPELPGVAVPAEMFPGVLGVAPSHDLMGAIRRREDELRARGGPVVDQVPERALPPSAAEGLRTIPPRETGGNLDVRQLVTGSRAYLPVLVPGALFSVGDLHFAQGEGEVCGFGIEIAGAITVRFAVHRSPAWRPRFPAFEAPGRRARPCYLTTGMPITADGRNEPMDLTLSAKNAVREMIGYLGATRGLSPEQAYILASAAVDLRIAEVVDVPNAVVAAALPLDIFET